MHIGPHFGSYDEEVTETRVSEILCYALDVLNFGSPDSQTRLHTQTL